MFMHVIENDEERSYLTGSCSVAALFVLLIKAFVNTVIRNVKV